MSRIVSGEVRVDGIRELNRALKRLGGEFPGELKEANREAADFVAAGARGRAVSLGSTAAHVAPSIRASAGQQSAAVSFGGAAYPMAGGAEFGAIRYKQFQPWRGSGSDAGYFVYPTIRDNSERIADTYVERLDDLLRRANLI